MSNLQLNMGNFSLLPRNSLQNRHNYFVTVIIPDFPEVWTFSEIDDICLGIDTGHRTVIIEL